jgi:hypothetical protein
VLSGGNPRVYETAAWGESHHVPAFSPGIGPQTPGFAPGRPGTSARTRGVLPDPVEPGGKAARGGAKLVAAIVAHEEDAVTTALTQVMQRERTDLHAAHERLEVVPLLPGLPCPSGWPATRSKRGKPVIMTSYWPEGCYESEPTRHRHARVWEGTQTLGVR